MIADVSTIQLARKTAGGHSIDLLTLIKKGDGSFEFTGTNGQPVRTYSDEAMRALFEAATALA